MRAIAAWVGVVVIGAGVGGGLALAKFEEIAATAAAAAAMPEPATAVATAVARPGTWAPQAHAIGTVAALRRVELRGEVAGTVVRVGFASGDVVAAGQALVGLDARAERASLAVAEAEMRLAALTLDRREGLRDSPAFSPQELDRAREELAAATARAEALRVAIDKKTIRAPFRGRIGISDLQPGAYLEAGSQVATIHGVDDDAFVDFALPQDAGAALGVGAAVDVAIPALGAPVRAVIEAESEAVDRASRTVTYRARATATGERLRPGMFVDVFATIAAPKPIVLVPRTALRRSTNGAHVFVLEPGEGGIRASLRPVQAGQVQDGDVAIEEGLRVGELVAAEGSFKLMDGALVASETEGGV